MRFYKNISSNSYVYDATGNFILSKNDTAIYVKDLENAVICNFRIEGVNGNFKDKLRITFGALKFIWSN